MQTPKINQNAGRDHYPKAFSALLAGGGVKGGYIHGKTDSKGAEPVDQPVTIADFNIKSVEGILARSGSNMSELRVSFIGLGSMGKGTLDLMLDVLPHPRGIIMSDLYQQGDRLKEFQDQLLASGFSGEIDICSCDTKLSDKVYEAELIIAVSNIPNIIDIDKVRSGSMVVDYSFPSSFSVIDAAKLFFY